MTRAVFVVVDFTFDLSGAGVSEAACRLGMRAVLVARSGAARAYREDLPVIQSLRELPPVL